MRSRDGTSVAAEDRSVQLIAYKQENIGGASRPLPVRPVTVCAIARQRRGYARADSKKIPSRYVRHRIDITRRRTLWSHDRPQPISSTIVHRRLAYRVWTLHMAQVVVSFS